MATMDREMRLARKKLIREMRKLYPRLPARSVVVVRGSDGAYTAWIDNERPQGKKRRNKATED